MANQGQNEGFRVLDDFVCEALHDPAAPRITLSAQGQNEGMRVVEEFVVDLKDAVRVQEREADADEILRLLREAKQLAQEYRLLTGKPLGITGEVAEYEAARVLGIKLTPARQAGYDAVETTNGTVRKLQIKGRCLLDNCKRTQMLGSIRIDKEWDAVLMVLLDQNFDAVAIYQAERAAVEVALRAPGSIARNERGAMAVSKFKSIGKLRWKKPAV